MKETLLETKEKWIVQLSVRTLFTILFSTIPGTTKLIRQLQRRLLCRNVVLILLRMFIYTYFRYYENLTPVMVVSDVEMIKQILVKGIYQI